MRKKHNVDAYCQFPTRLQLKTPTMLKKKKGGEWEDENLHVFCGGGGGGDGEYITFSNKQEKKVHNEKL